MVGCAPDSLSFEGHVDHYIHMVTIGLIYFTIGVGFDAVTWVVVYVVMDINLFVAFDAFSYS